MDQMIHNFNSKVSGFKANCQKEMLLAESQLAKINRPASSTGIVKITDEFWFYIIFSSFIYKKKKIFQYNSYFITIPYYIHKIIYIQKK